MSMGRKRKAYIIPTCPRCHVQGNLSQDEHSLLITCLTCAWVGNEKEFWDSESNEEDDKKEVH